MSEHPLLSMLNGELVAVDATRQSWFESCLNAVAQHPKFDEFMAESAGTSESDGFWPPPDNWRAQYRPYLVKDGILTIPVFGVLLNRFSFQMGHWATGYTYVERALRRGLEDPEVRGIVLMCDTPGGEVSGLFELSDRIFDARGQKPMLGIAADRAYSAGYAIISGAPTISSVRTGGLGSIGVMTLHLDFSGALEQDGIKATFIFAGKRKVDGNRFQPLSERAQQRIQSRIDYTMDIFVETVVRNRGMEEEAVRGTEGDCFSAEEALALGLTDRIETREDALVSFTELCTSGSGNEDYAMTKSYSQTELDTAVAAAKVEGAEAAKKENETASAAAREEGKAEGAKAERDRINAIIGSDEAKKRPAAAFAAALESDMDAEAAKTFLSKLPEEKVGEKEKADGGEGAQKQFTNAFEKAMASENPDVGSGEASGGGDGQPTEDQLSQNILGAMRQFSGPKEKQDAAQG